MNVVHHPSSNRNSACGHQGTVQEEERGCYETLRPALCRSGLLAISDFRGVIVRSEVAKGCHKVFDLAGRRGFAGFKVALNA
jgi:hypothetical protein